MADFISQIQNIATLYAPSVVNNSQKIEQIATLISRGTIDSVNFSQEGKTLFDIAQLDRRFDDLLGLPNDLTSAQNSQLQNLGSIVQNLFSQGSLQKKESDYDAIMQNISTLYEGQTLTTAEREKIATLSGELQAYIQNLAITQLFSPTTTATSNTLFNTQLSSSEKSDLGKIAQQLNRVLFIPTDEEGSSFLDTLNSLYGLNDPSNQESDDIFSLFLERNNLLSSVLLNRNLASNYGDLL